MLRHVITMPVALCAALTLVAMGSDASAAEPAKKAAGKSTLVVFKLGELVKDTKLADIRKLEKGVKKVKGVSFVSASRKKGALSVKHRPTTDLAAIKAAIVKAGFTIVENGDTDAAATAAPMASEDDDADLDGEE